MKMMESKNKLLKVPFPNGGTFLYGIIGNPVKHSASPYMQTQAFHALGINAIYVPFEVKKENIKDAIKALKVLNVKGVNVTVPYKEEIIPYLDEIDRNAKIIGSVNTIKIENEKAFGFNTDAPGFILALKEEGISVKGKNILILGAGGTSKALSYILLKEGVNKIFVLNRTFEKAKKIENHLKSYGNIEAFELSNENLKNFLPQVDIIINTTSLGLKKDDPPIFDYSLFSLNSNLVVVDVIYFETPFLRAAKKYNLKTVNGKGMLLYQGALAFEIWTSKKAPIEVMRKALNEILK